VYPLTWFLSVQERGSIGVAGAVIGAVRASLNAECGSHALGITGDCRGMIEPAVGSNAKAHEVARKSVLNYLSADPDVLNKCVSFDTFRGRV
jgi:hypothetical protein